MSKDIRVIREDCCTIWNKLKDKTQMIDCLIESKQQIADLEAKLAESEKEADKYWGFFNQEAKECSQLKQQLAEKEKEIKELTECNQYLQIYRNQDKISFCIEKIEKVKEDVKNVHIEDTQYDCYCYQETTRDKCVKIIDNQIEELKKEIK